MNRAIAISTLASLMAACATTSGYEAVLNSWVGDTSDHLVSVWGVPQQTFRQNSGGSVLQYERSGQIVLPGMTTYQAQTTYNSGSVSATSSNGNSVDGTYNGTSTTYVPHTSAPTVIARHCETRFTADASGRITNWNWQGNACKATAPKGPKGQQAVAPTIKYEKCSADQLRTGTCA
jgi:hypothetical protein